MAESIVELPACTSREIPTLCWVLFTFSPAWIFTKLHQLHSATSLWTLCHHPSDSAATLRRKAEVRLHLNDFTRAIAACRRWHAVGRMYGSTQRHSDKIWWLLYIYISLMFDYLLLVIMYQWRIIISQFITTNHHYRIQSDLSTALVIIMTTIS